MDIQPTFTIESSTGPYGVTIATGLLATPPLREILSKSSIVADAFFKPREIPGQPIWIEATEYEKSLDRAPALIEQLRKAGANRTTLLTALGGGILQDISAFVASVYMRGLKWVYIPTTVLAMVDSCIGGKSSINVGPYKNLVGTFHPPEHIYIDPSLAETLPRDQFASGLIEAAKICFTRGPESFAEYLAASPSISMSTPALEQVIRASLSAKKHFIEVDEFDKKERLLLNFGHTFGHALEGASDYGIPHGIGVGLGILCSLAFQRQRGIAFDAAPRVSQLEQHLDTMIRTLPNLAAILAGIQISEVLERFASDKKHSTAQFAIIVVNPQGQVEMNKLDRTPELDFQIRHAIESTLHPYIR